MPLLFITQERKEFKVHFEIGMTIREILDTTPLRVYVGCRGNGACGLCLIQINDGKVNEPQPNEWVHLSENQINQSIRLACQTKPLQNVRIELPEPVSQSNWRTIPPEDHFIDTLMPSKFIKNGKTDECKRSYSVAVDLGPDQYL